MARNTARIAALGQSREMIVGLEAFRVMEAGVDRLPTSLGTNECGSSRSSLRKAYFGQMTS